MKSRLDKIGGPNPVFPINLKGRSLPVLQFLIMLGETSPFPGVDDSVFWQIKLNKMNWN